MTIIVIDLNAFIDACWHVVIRSVDRRWWTDRIPETNGIIDVFDLGARDQVHIIEIGERVESLVDMLWETLEEIGDLFIARGNNIDRANGVLDRSGDKNIRLCPKCRA